MKPNQLNAFSAVATHLSIRGAARALGLSQPGITRIVRELERELDAPLVERGSKGVKLTPYGIAFAPRARQLLEDMRRACDEIAQIRDGERGHVRMAVTSSFALTHLPGIFTEFHERNPSVDVHFSEAVMPGLLLQLLDGRLDFAVVHLAPASVSPEFETIPLYTSPLVVGMRTHHPLRRTRSLRTLHEAEWILPGDGSLKLELVRPIFAPINLEPPARIVQAQSVAVALGLVSKTDLIGVFAEELVDVAFKNHGIRRVDVLEAIPPLQVCVVKRRERQLTPAAQQFVDCMMSNLKA